LILSLVEVEGDEGGYRTVLHLFNFNFPSHRLFYHKNIHPPLNKLYHIIRSAYYIIVEGLSKRSYDFYLDSKKIIISTTNNVKHLFFNYNLSYTYL